MNITIQNYQPQYNPYFCSRKINITREQILSLRAQGKKEMEIPKLLGISLATYYTKLKQLEIPNVIKEYKQKLAQIPREEFERMLQEKVPIEDFCKKFNLTVNAYYNYIDRYGLRSYIVGANRRAVTKEQLQELVDKKLSIDEICEQLNIGKNAYFGLLQKFNILTEYKSNKLNVQNITREQLVELINNGKTNPEIAEQLGISQPTLQRLIGEFHIKTKYLQSKKIISSISKEQLQELVNSGKSTAEICKELNIPIRTYSRLISQYGIMTKTRQAKKHLSSIKKEELQQLVDEGLTKEEICRKLKLAGESTFYILLKRLNIRYNYRHHIGEINIPRGDLQKVVDEWESVQDIQDKLKISDSAFYEKSRLAKVKTVLRDSIDRLKNLNIQDIQEMMDMGATPKEICEMYDLTPALYNSLIRKYNLVSSLKRKYKDVQSITKEQLETLINSGKRTKDICEELNISSNTYQKLLNKFGIERNK